MNKSKRWVRACNWRGLRLIFKLDGKIAKSKEMSAHRTALVAIHEGRIDEAQKMAKQCDKQDCQ